MKSSSAAADRIITLSSPVARNRGEAEFLPAALEIIETPASPVGRAIAGVIITFLLAAIVWASFGKVDIIATTQGRIIPTGKSKLIQPFETGVVRAIHVADGVAVKAGDVLIELDPTSDTSDETRLTFNLMQDRLDMARLRALLDDDLATFAPPADADARLAAMARQQMEAQAGEHQAKIEGIERQIAQKKAEGSEVQAAIAKLEASLPLISEQRDIRNALLGNQYGSRLAYLQAQQSVVENQHDLDGQKHRQEENVEALAALERQRVETEAEYRKSLFSDLAKAEAEANEHQEEVHKSALKRNLRTLRAPVDGTVQQLAVHTLGGVVTPAEQLMVIVPKGADLEIEATLANKDVGFVHKGQEVEIKVEAFTFTRYGLLHGVVASVSQDAVATQDSDQAARGSQRDDADVASDEKERQARQPTYVAHVTLTATGIRTEQGLLPVEPGMAVTAEIKTGRRSVISYLLSPLMRFRQEGLRER